MKWEFESFGFCGMGVFDKSFQWQSGNEILLGTSEKMEVKQYNIANFF